MKKLSAFLLLAVVALFAFRPLSELPIGSEMPMPDVKMLDVSGKEVSLKSAMGKKGLLVMFSCNTCPYVVKNQSRTIETGKYAKEQQIGVIVVNSNEAFRDEADSYEEMKKYGAGQGYQWPYVVDKNSALADAFGANRTPECFLFDSKGKLVYHGAIDDNPSNAEAVTRKHLQAAMDELAAGKEITVKTSRSVGCSIKRKS